MFDDMRRIVWMALFSGLITACAPHIPPQPVTQEITAPEGFPESHYRQADADGQKILRVDAGRSLVRIDVHRAGTLARLGHNHVVASRNVQGYVALDEGRSDLYIPLDRLTVDEPGLLQDAGFAAAASQQAIDGTRRNMLEKVLDSERFPFALVRITRAKDDQSRLAVAITLRGATRSYDVPAQFETTPQGIAVSGRMSFNQSDFGIRPFSILGGALQVEDRLHLRFHIVARLTGQ